MLGLLTIIFLMMWILLIASLFLGKEKYENWDFMDLPNYCGGRKRRPSSPMETEDGQVAPRFGGIPNQSQVWGIGEVGGCGCAKVFH